MSNYDALGRSLFSGVVGLYPRKYCGNRVEMYYFKIIDTSKKFPVALLIRANDERKTVTTSRIQLPQNCVNVPCSKIPIPILMEFNKYA